ncbi:MAG: 7TM diverse intracellular signaling domain-containing protein [Bacteroidota bacterium]|nr:7TM diverse intracellular signaling domain-containing protein [Bacteroidota bacterium]
MKKTATILKLLHYIFFCLLAVSSCILSIAQISGEKNNEWNSYMDISQVSLEKKIGQAFSSSYIDKNVNLAISYPDIIFTPALPLSGRIPNERISQKVLVRFNLTNSADTTLSIYFCPGFYFSEINLYEVDKITNRLNKLPAVLPPGKNNIGYRSIPVLSKDSVTIIAELGFVKTYNNAVRPRLIHAQQLPAFMATLQGSFRQTDLITYVFCGLLLMMLLFSLTNFLQGGTQDFLFYSGYALFIGGMLFIQTVNHFRTNPFSYFYEGFLDFILQSTGIIFYMLFMQRFLNTREFHPFLFKLYNAGIIMLIASMATFSGLHYFSDNYIAENLVENTTKILLLLMIIIFLVYSLRRWNDKLLRYLFWGNLFLFIFALLSQLAIILSPVFKNFPGVFGASVFYYETGLFLELVFFLAGLNYKNRRQLIAQTKERETLKTQNQLQEYEKEIAVYKAQQEERQRISADMHDELGSGMTAIRLMSEIARNKMKENTPVEIDKISSSADDVLNNMNAIIWSMNSGNDTLDNLVSYIRSWALEYFDNTPIDCMVHTPENIPNIELAGDKRRNIFLCVKETLNNVLKHSKATLLTITIEANQHLLITIADNGRGIDMENLRQFGNGLKNITRRMQSVGGTFTIKNSNGTLTELELPL